MCLQRGLVGGKRRAVGSMNDAATIEDDGVVGDAKNFVGVLLDQDGGDAFVADDAAQRACASILPSTAATVLTSVKIRGWCAISGDADGEDRARAR
jgi:hypothetical protein